MRASARSALALLVALNAASAARAVPRLQARPAFSPLRSTDPACAVVTIENDGVDRRGTLVAARRESAPGGFAFADHPIPETRLDVRLPAGSRRRFFLPVPAGGNPRGRIELRDADGTLATTLVDFGNADLLPELVAVTGPRPPAMSAAVLRAPQKAEIAEVDPADLPPNVATWPELDAFVWEAPRSSEIAPEAARAVRDYVRQGGRLVVGVSPEEPEALQALGVGDLLPARPSLDEAGRVSVLREAGAGVTHLGDGAIAGRHGFGSVVLVPGRLDGVTVEAWPGLLQPVDPSKLQVAEHGADRRRWREWALLQVPGQHEILAALVPDPPWEAALLILSSFVLAIVPVEWWLRRRAVRRRRRTTAWSALRYPLLVAAAMAAGAAVAHHASGAKHRTHRVDVVEVAQDGSAIGRTLLLSVKGGAGRTRIAAPGAVITHVVHAHSYGTQPLPAVLEVPPGEPSAPGTAEIDADPWAPALVRTTWTPVGLPRVTGVGSCDAVLPAAAGVASDCAGVPRVQPSRFDAGTRLDRVEHDENDPSAATRQELLHWALDGVLQPQFRFGRAMPETGRATLVLLFERRLGPDITVDGTSTDEGETWTLVRHAAKDAP